MVITCIECGILNTEGIILAYIKGAQKWKATGQDYFRFLSISR